MTDHAIPVPLPDPRLTTSWRDVTSEFRRTKAYYPALLTAFLDACRRPGWNPKTVQMAGFVRAIDFCADSRTGEFHSYKVALVVDHPILATLPPNAPRAIRHIYSADIRLKYALAKEGWDFMRDVTRADEAAEEYNDTVRRTA